MVCLEFTVTPDQCSRFYDAISCLGKISDSVTIEARAEQLTLTALNSSKSAYLLFAFNSHEHFTTYDFTPEQGRHHERFACRILNKALISAFKHTVSEHKVPETGLESCQVRVDDHPDRTECRFNIRMLQRHGVTKVYALTYESVEAMHALFDKNRAANRWKIHSKMLRGVIEHFGPRTEQLDIYAEEGRVTLTSYIEKIVHGKEVLKQPLQTAVSLDTNDFDEFNADDSLHIAINVKDFKTMVMHAQTLNATVTAMYSQPSKPLQFNYSALGMRCEFTLMTIGGEFRATTAAPASRNASRPPSVPPTMSTRTSNFDMPPPPRPATRSAPQQTRRLGSRQSSIQPNAERGTTSDQDPDSLFLPPDVDDSVLAPVEERNDNEDMLGWDGGPDNDDTFRATFQDSLSTSAFHQSARSRDSDDMGIAPTQRASQIQGLFDN